MCDCSLMRSVRCQPLWKSTGSSERGSYCRSNRNHKHDHQPQVNASRRCSLVQFLTHTLFRSLSKNRLCGIFVGRPSTFTGADVEMGVFDDNGIKAMAAGMDKNKSIRTLKYVVVKALDCCPSCAGNVCSSHPSCSLAGNNFSFDMTQQIRQLFSTRVGSNPLKLILFE